MFDFRDWCDVFVVSSLPEGETELLDDGRVHLAWQGNDEVGVHAGEVDVVLEDSVREELIAASFSRQCEIGERLANWLALHVHDFEEDNGSLSSHFLVVDRRFLPTPTYHP